MTANSDDLTADRKREALRAHTRQLADSIGAARPDAPVPTCPGWTTGDLAEHVGQTQHWVAEMVERRVVDPSGLPTDMATLPSDPTDWPGWLLEGGARAADAFTDEALVAPVFNAAADDRTGGEFWLSSLLNESVVHGADAAYTAGRDVEVDADVAAHLITNHLTMLTSPTWAAQRPESAGALRGTGETLHWHADDRGLGEAGDWFVERGTEAATWRRGSGEAQATVTGPARSLLLVLTRRWTLDEESGAVSVDGDTDLVRHWIDNSAHVAD